jgi:peptidyl-prolyl cis-trans isomerase C
MKRRARGVGSVAGWLAVAIMLLSCAPAVQVAPPEDTRAERPVVRVGETVLSEADLDRVMKKLVPSSIFHGGVSEGQKAKYRPKAIEMLMEEELFYQDAKRRGMRIEKETLDEAMAKYEERYGGKKRFRQALSESRTTESEFRERVERRFLITKYVASEITQKATVSDEEVEGFYERHKEGFKRPKSVRMLHILIQVEAAATLEERQQRRQRAEEVLEKLRQSGDFAQLAWDYSDDPYRVKGGDFGMIHKGRLAPQLEKVVFALEPGETSDVIETIYGFHIARVKEVTEPQQLSLEEVGGDIRKKMEKQKREAIRSELFTGLRESAEIEVYDW